MRGVGPVPVMSPMSKYRKHERSTSKTKKNGQTDSGGEPKKQKLDFPRAAANGSSSGGNAADSSRKSGVHRASTNNNQRASLDNSSNRTFALRTPKIVKVTAGDNDAHGCSSPVENSFSLPSNVSQTQQPSVSSPSFSTTPGQANSGTPGTGEETAAPRPGAVRRRRRPYVDVRLREGDETRILGYRIKVWWPLDKKWYTGEVRDYDSLQQRHWIIYDDHEHEWLRLSDECFKLQLAPGDCFECPTGVMKDAQRQRSSSRGRKPRGATTKAKLNSLVDDHSSAVGAGPGSDQDENPSWRGMSADNSAKPQDSKPASEKPLSVYTRRKRSKGTSGATPEVSPAAPDEVQSPAPILKEPEVREEAFEELKRHDRPAANESGFGSSMVDQVAKEAVQVDATGMPPATSAAEDKKVDGSFLDGLSKVARQVNGLGWRTGALGLMYIDRCPLSRNVSELLRHVEVWSGGDRGSLVGSWVLNQVWRGLQPVWNIGPLFSLNFGTFTELHASGDLVQHGRLLGMGTSDGNTMCMLHIEMGPVFSVSLSCEPPSLLDAIRNRECVSSEDTHRPLADHSSKDIHETHHSSVASNLRQILKRRWKELHTKGLRLTFLESAALLSSQYAHFMLRARSLNRESATTADESDADSTVDARVGVQELLSLSKKGKRSVKPQKRGISQFPEDENVQQSPPKRARLEEQEVKVEECDDPKSYHSNVLKLTRCPSRKGMWCVAETTTADTEQQASPSDPGKRRMLEYIDDEDIGEYEHDMYDELDAADLGKEMDSGRNRSFNKRKRRRTETRRSPADYDPSPCMGNVLIVQSDRGWREVGATVELQSDGKSWALTISLNGEVLYSLKVMQRINHGVSNKYTHAMMWKGGKDWILEFPDKMQWSQFRFMHDVCCDRNARASCVKHIPIPGVREVEKEELDEPYVRPEAYIRTVGEMEAALSSDRVLYDLDQEDEQWLQQVNSGPSGAFLSEDMFERTVHQLERASYVRSEEVSVEDALEICSAFCSSETVKLVHSYWLERRKQAGGPLVRCFQPLPWERYAALLRAYEESQRHPVTRQQTSRPTPFAFCLRPIGLEAPNRPQRQRSQRRLMSRPLNPFDSSQFDYSDHPFVDDSPKSRDTVYLSPSYAFLGQEKPTEGSPGLDIVDDGVYPPRIITKYRSKSRKKLRKIKSISGTEEQQPQVQPQTQHNQIPPPTTRLYRTTFIAPPTAVHLENNGYIGDHAENDSSSSFEVDINDETVAAKAAYARKAARIAAAKAALAQELYAIADAKMNKAISCLIEAEAIAAVERAAREASEQQDAGMVDVAAVQGFGDDVGDGEDRQLEDEDLFLPIGGSCWTQEFGSGLIQRTSTTTTPLEVQSPRIKQQTVGGLRSGRTVTGRAMADGMVS